jgi:hypothetical protein
MRPLNVPLPAGKAINIEGGIANDPAVTGAWQTKPTGTVVPPAVVVNPPLISISFNGPEVESAQLTMTPCERVTAVTDPRLIQISGGDSSVTPDENGPMSLPPVPTKLYWIP